MSSRPPSASQISIVIAAYNEEHRISRALDSIAWQAQPPDEIIVVDDGSTDRTVEIVRNHSVGRKISLRCITQANGGVASARNFGIKSAKSDWIALLDADDEFLPNHIETLSDALLRNPDAVVIFGSAERVFSNNDIALFEAGLPDFRRIALDHSEPSNASGDRKLTKSAFSAMLHGNFIPNCSVIFHRFAANRQLLYHESLRYAEDRYLFLRLMSCGNLIFVDRKISKINRDGQNSSNTINAHRNAKYAALSLMLVIKSGDYPKNSANFSLIQSELNKKIYDWQYFSSTRTVADFVESLRFQLRWSSDISVYKIIKSSIRLIYSKTTGLFRQ